MGDGKRQNLNVNSCFCALVFPLEERGMIQVELGCSYSESMSLWTRVILGLLLAQPVWCRERLFFPCDQRERTSKMLAMRIANGRRNLSVV